MIGNAMNANASYTMRLKDDTGNVVLSVRGFDVTEDWPPNITLSTTELYKREGSFDISYQLSDMAYTNKEGSGIGKLEIYNDDILNRSININSQSYSSNYVFSPAQIADGEERSYDVCFDAYDRTRNNRSECLTFILDKRAPVLNSLNIMENISDVPRSGINVTLKANISDTLDITASADFTRINIDNPTGYSNKHADSCLREGSFWICTWNNITVKLNSGGDYNITVSLSDQLGNSRQAVSTERIAAVNHAPVVSVSNITVSEGSLITITPSATDLDGDTITFSYSGWMNSSTYQTTYHDQGTYQVTVTANDGFDGTDSKTITVRVNNVNVPDLEISNISFKPAMPVSNTPIMLRFVIINIGEVPAQDIRWEIVDSSAVVSTQQDLFDLDTDEDIAVYALVKYPAPGIYNPRISVDPTDNIKEIYEDNNEDSVQIVVG